MSMTLSKSWVMIPESIIWPDSSISCDTTIHEDIGDAP
jgi:hypothetical protein